MIPEGKVLLANWNEERTVLPLDKDGYQFGHKALLTLNENSKLSSNTEVTDNFGHPHLLPTGKAPRASLIEKVLFDKFSKEVDDENNPPPPPMPKESVTHKDYNIPNFISVMPEPTMPHDLKTEQPITFWTTHKNNHGMTQVKTLDTPFRRNAQFSTPISENKECTEPHRSDSFPFQATDGYN